MRSYFSRAATERNLSATPVDGENLHWDLLSALVQGSVAHVSSEVTSKFQLAISERNVELLLEACDFVEARIQKYDRDTNIVSIRMERQLMAFLKKFPFTKEEGARDTRSAAIQKWKSAEDKCRETNDRIKGTAHADLPKWVSRAKELISEVLGDILEPSVMTKVMTSGSHGPGATLSSCGTRVTQYYKYHDLPMSVTRAAAPYALAVIRNNPTWLSHLENSGRRTRLPRQGATRSEIDRMIFLDCVTFTDSDRITFVPKDARAERPIAVGACLNIYLQLGVKAYIEDRLKIWGIDLTDQERNARYAYLGSRYAFNGSVLNPKQFSTIDLASASDTISNELVRLLLPPAWYGFLDDLRHKSGDLEGEIISYEKFSAMGNGYTFPLETLIFWACCKAALDEAGYPSSTNDLIAYGDDIICRYEGHRVVVTALEWAGFLVNHEKSFVSGLFKESCGKDYFLGQDVRPFYLKRRIETYEQLYFICNSLAEKFMAQGSRSDLLTCFAEALGQIPVSNRRYAPLSTNLDTCLRVPFAWLREQGLAPFLRPFERAFLARRGVLDDSIEFQAPFFIREVDVAKTYKGKGNIRLMLKLSQGRPIHSFMGVEDLLHIEAASAGVVTRRHAVRRVTRVVPCSNWDGGLHRRSLQRHPVYQVK
uniref:RNA-directed RNA polymerase n=1 Tax=Beihai levi-like virus 33 TaxID=1922419 RepID=A0A1L3KI47_9VIRU|nr:hypothetical protein [Beihai levi-like virus 33]